MDLSLVYNWFHQYSQSFYASDPEIMQGIRLKEDHSVRVAANARALAQHLQLGEPEMTAAEAAGLLHDVARHPQWTKFRSFNDTATKYDHGTEGARILASTAVLNPVFSQTQQDIILLPLPITIK